MNRFSDTQRIEEAREALRAYAAQWLQLSPLFAESAICILIDARGGEEWVKRHPVMRRLAEPNCHAAGAIGWNEFEHAEDALEIVYNDLPLFIYPGHIEELTRA